MLEWIISASVLIIMVMVSRKLLMGKISCWVQYSLWLLVAVRLLVPVSPLKSALSVVNLLPENWAGQEAGEIPGGNAIGSAYGAEPGQDGISRQEGMSDMAVPAVPQPADDGHSLTEGIHPVEKMDASLLGSDIYGKITRRRRWSILTKRAIRWQR